MKALAAIALAVAATIAVTFGAARPAAALSCLPPDPVRLYTQARDAEARYRIVHGTLTALQPIRKHRQDPSRRFQPRPIRIKARLQGLQLGRGGFVTPIDTPVTVRLACFGPWCGGWPGTDQLLMSVEDGREGALTVTSDPCGSQIFPKPSQADLRRVIACHTRGACAERQR